MQDTKQFTSSQEQLDQHAHLWDVRSEKERETLKLVAIQYGLDPLTREVMILNGQVYVTASGLQKLALRDPEYDGCEVDIVEARWEQDFFVVKARVWKKSCTHPFEDYGDADPTTSKLKGHALFRHAVTRARARAMRSAFAVPFCAVEELDDEQRIQWLVQQRSHTPEEPLLATEKQRTTLLGLCKQIGLSRVALGAELDRRFGTAQLDDLTRSQASAMIQDLIDRAKEHPVPQETVVSEEPTDLAPHDSTEISASRQISAEIAQVNTELQRPEDAAFSDSHADQPNPEPTSAQTVAEISSQKDLPSAKVVAKAPSQKDLPSADIVAETTHPKAAKPAPTAVETTNQKDPRSQKGKPQREAERDAHGRKAGRSAVSEKSEAEQESAISNPEEAAKKILGGILRTNSLEALREQWEHFRAISDQFPKDLVDRITQAKDQRKSALM